MSLVIDADGHVEETLPELVDAIPSAMRDSAMQFVAEAGGYVTYRIEGRLWRSKYPFPGGLQNHVSAGGVRREGGRDPKVRLRVLDDEGIDAAVLYPSVGLMFGAVGAPGYRGCPLRGLQRLAGPLLRHRREASDRRGAAAPT